MKKQVEKKDNALNKNYIARYATGKKEPITAPDWQTAVNIAREKANNEETLLCDVKETN